ncbi:copper amine oxidase N-terminal domain-containing protein [Paenibacillus sp. CAU 1782]
MRRFHYVLILLLLMSYSTPVFAADSNSSHADRQSVHNPSITINGKNITFEGPLPALVNGKTYVPVQLFEHAEIQANIWEFLNGKDPNLTISYSNESLNVYLDRREYMVYTYMPDGERKQTPMEWSSPAPYLLDGDIMVPLRWIAERMGITVEWNAQTSTAILTTDEIFRAELDLPEEWEEWLGEKPMKIDDPTGLAITEDELSEYATSNELFVLDSRIVDKYTAIFLYISEEDGSQSLTTKYVERLRNGSLEGNISVGVGKNDNDITLRRSGHLLAIGMFEQGLEKNFTHFKVVYYHDGERKETTHSIAGKQGLFFELPNGVTGGTITFYGEDDYVYETYFY